MKTNTNTNPNAKPDTNANPDIIPEIITNIKEKVSEKEPPFFYFYIALKCRLEKVMQNLIKDEKLIEELINIIDDECKDLNDYDKAVVYLYLIKDIDNIKNSFEDLDMFI